MNTTKNWNSKRMLLQMAASFHKSYHPTDHFFCPMSFGDQNLITILETQIIISTGLWSNHSTNPLRLSTCLSTCLSTSLYIIPSSTSLNISQQKIPQQQVSQHIISQHIIRAAEEVVGLVVNLESTALPLNPPGNTCPLRAFTSISAATWVLRSTKTVHPSVPTLTLLGLQILISPMSNWTLVAVKDTLRIKICTIVLYRIVLYCIVLYCIVLYCIVCMVCMVCLVCLLCMVCLLCVLCM